MESHSTTCRLSCGCPVWRPRRGQDTRAQGSITEEQAVITLSPSRGPPRRRSPPRRLLVRPGVEPRRRTSLDLTPITHTSEHDARRRRLPARPFARSPRDCRCLSTPPTQINFLRSPERGRIPTGTVSRVRPGSPRCLFLRVLRHFPPGVERCLTLKRKKCCRDSWACLDAQVVHSYTGGR
jgi:hypothetical protein